MASIEQHKTCGICMEKITNRGKTKGVICESCNEECCRTCCETYLLDQPIPKCMFPECSNVWSPRFLDENFTKVFLNKDYRKHQEEICFEKEKGLLPGTQDMVSTRINREKANVLKKQYLSELRIITEKYYNSLKLENEKFITRRESQGLDVPHGWRTWSLVTNRHSTTWYDKDYTKIYHKNKLDQRKEIIELRTRWLPVLSNHNERSSQQPRQFIRKCTLDDCKGFFDSNWKCGLCNNNACSACHEIKDDDHVCDQDVVATIKLIVNESKPCPGCKINITKIDGCNQIWCTSCKTAWDWKSGKIQTKIHNPHYFEYLRTLENDEPIERNPLEVRCGREIDRQFIVSLGHILRKFGYFNDDEYVISVSEKLRKLIHFEGVDLPKYTRIGDEVDNTELRISYMRNQITEKEFKRRIQLSYRGYNKIKEIRDVLVMFRQMSIEIMYKYRDDLDVLEVGDDITHITLSQLTGLEKYTNECLQTISKTYNIKPMCLNITDSTPGARTGLYRKH